MTDHSSLSKRQTRGFLFVKLFKLSHTVSLFIPYLIVDQKRISIHPTIPSQFARSLHLSQSLSQNISLFLSLSAVILSLFFIFTICPFLSSVAEWGASGLHLERCGGGESPTEDESAINLPPCHSLVHPLLLSFTIASSVSVLYLGLSVFPTSLSNPIFSQGWTCVMALLSPPCHLARPI